MAAARQWPELLGNAGYDLPRRRISVLASVGTGTHAATTYQLNDIIRTGNLGSLDDSIAVGLQAFRDDIVEGVQYDDSISNANEAERQIGRLARLYYVVAAPRIRPRRTEYALKATMGNAIISGRPDVVTVTGPFTCGVRDTKTGRRMRNHHAQLGAYSLLVKTDESAMGSGILPDALGVDFLKRGSASTAPEYKAKIYPVGECEKLAWATMKSICFTMERFTKSGNPDEWQMNPNSILCSEKWCPAYASTWCFIGREG